MARSRRGVATRPAEVMMLGRIESLESRVVLTAADTQLIPISVSPLTPQPTVELSVGGTLGSFKIWNQGDYTATVNWGDSSPTIAASVVQQSDGREYTADSDSSANLGDGTVKVDDAVYNVEGSHTYAKPGSYPVTVTVSGPDGHHDHPAGPDDHHPADRGPDAPDDSVRPGADDGRVLHPQRDDHQQ